MAVAVERAVFVLYIKIGAGVKMFRILWRLTFKNDSHSQLGLRGYLLFPPSARGGIEFVEYGLGALLRAGKLLERASSLRHCCQLFHRTCPRGREIAICSSGWHLYVDQGFLLPRFVQVMSHKDAGILQAFTNERVLPYAMCRPLFLDVPLPTPSSSPSLI